MSANRMRGFTHLALLAALAVAGCGGGDASEPAAEPSPGTAPTVTRNPVGVVNRAGSNAAIAEMRSSLNTLENTEADELTAMIPKHRQSTTEALLTLLETEMRSTGTTLSAEWQATAASVRQEVGGMAQMSAAQLQAVMPTHATNLRRLMELHETARP
jgi:hypothetical protein